MTDDNRAIDAYNIAVKRRNALIDWLVNLWSD